MIITNIVAGISSRISTVLGAGYGKLPYITDVEKNNYVTNSDRYGVRALTATQTDSVTKNVTNLQSFEIVLTKAYYQSKLDDDAAQTATHELQDSILDIYKDLINTRAGVPATVLNLTDLIIIEPEYIEESKVVVIRANFNILYRFSLI